MTGMWLKGSKKFSFIFFSFYLVLLLCAGVFKKGMGNLKYLLPSDEGILQFLSYITEIWSRDQFFHENQLCFRSGVIFW